MQSLREVSALLGRYSKPEQEYSQVWTPGTTLRSPSALRTDRLISFLFLHWSGRIAIATADFTPVPDALRYLFQEIRLSGTHARFGSQVPLRMRAKTLTDINKIYRQQYAPNDSVAKSGGGTTFDGKSTHSYDIHMFVTVPLFPLPMGLQQAPLYSIKGPDWAGNLFLEIDTGDATALGGVVANTTFSAFGSGSGSPTVFVSVVRPLISVDLMNRLSPGIPFRTERIIDSAVNGSSANGIKIADLNIGKRLASVTLQTGVVQGSLTANQRSYASFSNGIVTRSFISIDSKPLNSPWDGLTQQEWDGFLSGAPIPTGYLIHNFVRETGNPDAAFAAETLTSARRLELDGDVVGSTNQGAELVQEEILGSPAIASS